MKLSDRVKTWIEETGTQREALAAEMRVSISTLNRILADKPVSYHVLVTLSDVTGIPKDELIEKQVG